ncbi:MAG: hypothetical protein DMF90_22475 [Acidobacteria bacterium]|nr:MAG: hypothetical protein DMF90_22475 [Acidobacteriota bacterium]
MASETHPIFTPNLIVGLSVTAVGVVLALDQLQMADARQLFRYWPVAVILFGASMVVQSLQGGDLVEPGRKVRGYGAPQMFLLLLVLIVVSQAFHRERGADRAAGSDKVSLIAVMSQDNRVNTSTRFRGGEMTSFWGACRLDLRQATIPPGEEAVIDVFALMGGLTLQIPEGWTVDVQVLPVMGGVQDRRGLPDAPDRYRQAPAERVVGCDHANRRDADPGRSGDSGRRTCHRRNARGDGATARFARRCYHEWVDNQIVTEKAPGERDS